MNILATLTVKPLLYAVGALLLALAGVLVAWFVHATRLQAQLDVQTSAASSANAAYMAGRTRIAELTSANDGWLNATTVLQGELKNAQEQLVVVRAQGDAAIAAAQQRERDANRTLDAFMTKARAQAREPNCAQALSALQLACPAMEGY